MAHLSLLWSCLCPSHSSSPLGSQSGSIPLLRAMSWAAVTVPTLPSPATLAHFSTSVGVCQGTPSPWFSCWVLPGHNSAPYSQAKSQCLQGDVPTALCPVGEPVSSWLSLQWSCTPHLQPRSSGSCPARPRSCHPAATSRLSVPAMGTSASTTAGKGARAHRCLRSPRAVLSSSVSPVSPSAPLPLAVPTTGNPPPGSSH